MRKSISYDMLMMLVEPTGGATTVPAENSISGIGKLDFIQSYDFSFNVDRAALKQLGAEEFATRQTQFAPDVNLNVQYYLNDGWNENFIGLNINSGGYINPFRSIYEDQVGTNFYVIIAPDNGKDANSIASNSLFNTNQLTGGNVLGIGNCYISNLEINIALNQLATVDLSFVGANARIDSIPNSFSNYLGAPAVYVTGNNLELPSDELFAISTGIIKQSIQYIRNRDYPTVYKNEFNGGCPYSACQITSSSVLGSGISFGFDFENFQSMAISIPFERKSLYGFGGNYPFYRKIQKPIIGTFNIDSLVDSFQTEDIRYSFENEDKTTKGYNFDIMFSNYTGKNKFGIKIQNARLDSYSIGNSIGDRSIISTSWSFEINENTGVLFSGSYPEPTLISNRIADSFNTYAGY